jgi:alpha-mannosidase
VYHLDKRFDVTDGVVKVLENTPLRASLEVSINISSTSKMVQTITLNAISPRLDFGCEIDWDESHKFLKVEFPLAIRSLQASYEIQFGHLQRPTHWNTSWEVAKFEVLLSRPFLHSRYVPTSGQI